MANLNLEKDITISVTESLNEIARAHHKDTDSSNHDELQSGYLSIGASQTDVAIDFGTVTTAKYIYLESDVAITFKLGGSGNTATTLIANGHASMEVSTTSLHITTTTAAKVRYIISGA